MKVIDPVCGMEVDTDTATDTAEYRGQTYYFCGPGCKTAFVKDPEKYLSHAGHSHAGQQARNAVAFLKEKNHAHRSRVRP